MAHPRSDKERSISRDGPIIEVEERLTDTVRRAFGQGEGELRYTETPHEYVNADPNEVDLPDLPCCFVWMNNMEAERPNMGNMSQSRDYQGRRAKRSTSRRLEFFLNIHYVRSRLDTEEASKELRKVGWYLFDSVDDDMSLQGLMLQDPRFEGLDFYPRARVVQGNAIQEVSSVKLQITYRTVDRD